MKGYVAVVAVLCVAAPGCSSAEEDDAIAAADRFVQAVTDDDGAAACAAMAPATVNELETSAQQPCDVAVLDAAVPAGSRLEAETYGTMAQVRYQRDVVFVTRFGDGWRVLAAACTNRTGEPYDCQIAGR